MPAGGTLTVTSSLSGDGYVVFSVHDTGHGIPKQYLDKVFEPFFTTKETGTGLGLSIVSGIVKEHDGKIEAESAPGMGTTIRVSFRTSSNGGVEVQPQIPSAGAPKPTIPF